MSNVPTFRRSLETQELIERLSKLEPGALVSYADLSEVAGETITGGTPALQSAKRAVEKERGVALSVERGVGVRRLTDDEIVDDTHGARSRIRRQSKRALSRLSAVIDFASLSDEKKRTHQAHAVIYAVIADKASSGAVKRVQSTVNIDGASLLEAIRNERG